VASTKPVQKKMDASKKKVKSLQSSSSQILAAGSLSEAQQSSVISLTERSGAVPPKTKAITVIDKVIKAKTPKNPEGIAKSAVIKHVPAWDIKPGRAIDTRPSAKAKKGKTLKDDASEGSGRQEVGPQKRRQADMGPFDLNDFDPAMLHKFEGKILFSFASDNKVKMLKVANIIEGGVIKDVSMRILICCFMPITSSRGEGEA
jgi:hypothetical protein